MTENRVCSVLLGRHRLALGLMQSLSSQRFSDTMDEWYQQLPSQLPQTESEFSPSLLLQASCNYFVQ